MGSKVSGRRVIQVGLLQMNKALDEVAFHGTERVLKLRTVRQD